MNLKDCYSAVGGDFDEVMGRLRKEQLVTKFLYKFLDDKNFHLFEDSMSNKDYDEALRVVHTLKGICQNLAFTGLYVTSSQITNALKEKDYNRAMDMSPQLSKAYHQVIHGIKEYKNTMDTSTTDGEIR